MYIYATLDIEFCHSLKVRQDYSVYQIRIRCFLKSYFAGDRFQESLMDWEIIHVCVRLNDSMSNMQPLHYFLKYFTHQFFLGLLNIFGKWVYLVMFHQQSSAIVIRNTIIMIVIGFIAITKSWYLMVHVFPTHDNWINGFS